MAEFFIRRPIVAMVIAIVTVIVGLVTLSRLPIAEYPQVSPTLIEVTANYRRAAAEAVMDSASGYGIRRTEHHFELASVSRELVEKFSRRTKLIEQRARDKYKVLEAQARALMKSTSMAFDDAFAHVITEIGGDWDKWKSDLGARDREGKSSAKYKARQELVTHWQSEMTSQELASLRHECVKRAPSQNLLDARAAMELAVKHLFEHVSLKRELHIAGMLLRRGIARVGIAEASRGSDQIHFSCGLIPTGSCLPLAKCERRKT